MSAPDVELSLEWRRGVEVHLRVAVELGGQKTSEGAAEGDSRQSVERLVDDVPGLCVQAHGVSWRCNAVPVTRIIGPLGRITGFSSDPITRIPHPWLGRSHARGVRRR